MKLMPRRGEMQEEAKEKKKRTKGDIASLVILIVLAVILVPIFAINLTLIIKAALTGCPAGRVRRCPHGSHDRVYGRRRG